MGETSRPRHLAPAGSTSRQSCKQKLMLLKAPVGLWDADLGQQEQPHTLSPRNLQDLFTINHSRQSLWLLYKVDLFEKMARFPRLTLIKYIIAALCWSKALFSSIKIRDVVMGQRGKK